MSSPSDESTVALGCLAPGLRARFCQLLLEVQQQHSQQREILDLPRSPEGRLVVGLLSGGPALLKRLYFFFFNFILFLNFT